MEKEIWTVWKDTRNRSCGHLYEVSDQGRAKVDGEIIVFDDNSIHYYRLPCHDHLHRVVAILYVANPENKPVVDHINGNKHDNRACNLRWCTQKENVNNPVTRERHMVYWHSGKLSMDTLNRNNEYWALEDNHEKMSIKMTSYWNSDIGKTRKEIRHHYIHLNDITKIVEDEFLNYWLDDGWLYGRGKIKKNRQTQK